jgi:hypothetical protein
VEVAGEVLVQMIRARAENALSHNARTTATEAQFMGNCIDLHKVVSTDTLIVIAKDSLKTDADINDAKRVNLHGHNSVDVGGNLQGLGSTHISTNGLGAVSATIQSDFLDVQGTDLSTYGNNEITNTY